MANSNGSRPRQYVWQTSFAKSGPGNVAIFDDNDYYAASERYQMITVDCFDLNDGIGKENW